MPSLEPSQDLVQGVESCMINVYKLLQSSLLPIGIYCIFIFITYYNQIELQEFSRHICDFVMPYSQSIVRLKFIQHMKTIENTRCPAASGTTVHFWRITCDLPMLQLLHLNVLSHLLDLNRFMMSNRQEWEGLSGGGASNSSTRLNLRN